MSAALIEGDQYDFTAPEIAEVAVARITQMQIAAIVCRCGRVRMWISRDMGLTPKWAPAANVIERLRNGETIDGSVP